jgi:hypothetical protein
MAMSTMLYHENPPLRNETPGDLATMSPKPRRNSKVSEVCWIVALYHEIYMCIT